MSLCSNSLICKTGIRAPSLYVVSMMRWDTVWEMHDVSLVQFSRSVVSDSVTPWSQAPRPPCPSPTPEVHRNPCPLSQWCHPTISSSVVPFSSWLQSFPASGSFQLSQLFTSGGQSIGVSASMSVLPMNTQDWSLGWTGWISLRSKGREGGTNYLAGVPVAVVIQ